MKYLIIGAVAGGASTAARLRRMDEHADIVVFEKGEYISYANCGLPYYIGNVIADRNKLFVQTATAFNKRFNIDVRTRTEIVSIRPDTKLITCKNLETGEFYNETYDKLVLSPGAAPIKPPLAGINLPGIFTLRNVNDTDEIKNFINKNQVNSATVIGGGFIGLEMAENLEALGIEVTIIEMAGQVMAPLDFPIAAKVQQHIRGKGLSLRLNTAVTGFEQNDAGIDILVSKGDTIKTDMVILSIGVKPDSGLAFDAGLKTGKTGGITVNEYLQTSDPDIYAVGDAIEFINPITGVVMNTYLAGPANKQGRICADNIVLGNTKKYHGAINTSIVKVFDMTVGATGVAAKNLSAAGIPYIVSTTHSGSHAGYYPGSKHMTIQIAFSPEDGKLLGAQVAGYEGADKRLDILAMVIKNNGTIYDLADFEHAYAPPYSSAKDPVNMAGFVADNILNERLGIFYWEQVSELKTDTILLDVRTEDEYRAEHIENAINIPLDSIRNRMDELPKDKHIHIYCEAGLRGYLAQRILKQNGYKNILNLSGGYKLWKDCITEKKILDTLSKFTNNRL